MVGRLDKTAIYTPQTGQLLVVRGEAADRTVQWLLKLREPARWSPQPEPYVITIHGTVVGAQFSTEIDERIANQKASIDRLLKHVREHCPEFAVARERCPLNHGGEA
jgi:hypothetical protein